MSSRTESPLLPGDTLAGKYRIDRVLGTGGMGVVVAATRLTEGARDTVAIKYLRPTHHDNESLAARFRRECRVLSCLRSEHIVHLLDTGELDSGLPYFVMDLLEGRDLRALLHERRTLAVDEAATYVSQACAALTQVHDLGIVHRDLKPANLFLTRCPDGSALLKVVDFGIAKLISSKSAEDQQQLTINGCIPGTLSYMAPEQLLNEAVDGRADLWSLGVILYHLVTGLAPFAEAEPADLLVSICRKPPHPLRAPPSSLPDGFESVVRRCLEKRPQDRYPNAAQLALALRPFTSARPLAGPTSRPRGCFRSEPTRPLGRIGMRGATTPTIVWPRHFHSQESTLDR